MFHTWWRLYDSQLFYTVHPSRDVRTLCWFSRRFKDRRR